MLSPYLNFLRRFDCVASKRVDIWVAGSSNAQKRIKDVYKVNSSVIYPFVDLERFTKTESFNGGYLLVVSRLNAYKRVDLAVVAANRLKMPLKVVGVGPQSGVLQRLAGPSVEFLGNIGDALLLQLLAGCKALIVAGEEDFGLTPLEAQVLGKPVVAFKKGGALESIIPGETGFFFGDQTTESLVEALDNLDKKGFDRIKCKSRAEKFSKESFILEFKDLVENL